MNKSLKAALLAGIVLAASSLALGQGMLVPKDSTLPPLAIKSQQVEIAIDNQVATTSIKQVFMNSTSRQLEANYVFPLPAEATIRDFAMMVDGKRVSGELVEAGKARQIYQSIVAQARDPGLLEHLGDNLFRVNIFPVPANGTQTVELTYSQVVPASGGVYRYVYPLKTGSKASRVQEYFSVGLKLHSKVALKSVYSPTHEIGITRKGDHEAVAGLEISQALLDRDFSLYWTVSEKDFGLNAVSYRPNADADGYLMLLIAPKSSVNEKEIIAKDVQFVFDTSGSMDGKKIEQAKKALRYCVENLNAKDRFNVIAFSTDVNPFKDSLIDASKENRKAAFDYIDTLQAEGGTNIYQAIETALATARAGSSSTAARPQVIVFLTDGRPTINRTGADEIVGLLKAPEAAKAPSGPAAEQAKADAIRIFTFGVGDDVNTKLLDQVAQASGGQPEYVTPGEDIEVKVSDFFAKASHPVMTGLKLAFGGRDVKVSDLLPKSLPDLYFGQQIVAFGRFSGSGDVSVTLSGTVSNGKEEHHTYEVSLPKQSTENNFIEPLWAHRKVGFLLDQIRLNGESKELKDEVIRLSKAYKIQTPYTSYLVLEEQHRKQYLGRELAMNGQGGGQFGLTQPSPTARPAAPPATAEPGRPGESPRGPVAGTSPALDPTVAPPPADRSKLADMMRRAQRAGEAEGHESDGRWADGDRKDRDGRGRGVVGWKLDDLKAESGAAAVALAKDIAEKKSAETLDEAAGPRVGREAAGRSFYLLNGFWVDGRFDAKAKLTFVKFASEAYFAIVSAHEELKDVFALGANLIVATADGRAVVISESDGVEKLSADELAELFRAAAPTTQPEGQGG